MIKRLWMYLDEYKKEAYMTPVLMMLEAGIETYVPYIMAKMINIGIANNDLKYICKLGIIMLVLRVSVLFSCLP